MKNEAQTIIMATLFILSFGIASHLLLKNAPDHTIETAYGSWACTTDVQICPDGSTVERTPPYCHFAPCR